MPTLARHDRKAVLQGGRRDQEIGSGISERVAQSPPALGDRDVGDQDSIAIDGEDLIQPCAQLIGERLAVPSRPGNSPLYPQQRHQAAARPARRSPL
jgi:hypothetical protein